jgi:catechol 2,3-dioxygenase-like lactoylglutathione lyase family enzyme
MIRIHHVNVVVPIGRTEEVAAFYRDRLGLRQIPKPPQLDPRGAWFQVDELTQIHISERDGDAHRDAHFALVVDDFDAVVANLDEWTPQDDIFGGGRGFTRDPAGNRIELLERAGDLA